MKKTESSLKSVFLVYLGNMEETTNAANLTESEEFSRVFKIGVGFVSPISCLLIFSLYCGIIYYEKMGHDPLKRDLSNMLVSSICKTMAIHTITYFMINFNRKRKRKS